jgi:serine/threonine protein kinase
MVFQPAKDAELATGYRLIEKLGAGGYGEVWKASAPGGLTKAVKIVFGAMDGPQAEQELKALNRIKEVRHPFLLSLERIDVLNGQLIVVTELAESSLLDRYLECINSGLPGIPRDELLGHVRDAAEALDYMAETHGLQHLDVKPQNLLLVGGRMKVADFGQVRLLAGTGTTALGVTPVYATPEAFDGRVSRFSDQYSLAVVYQEMLTGIRPFPGTTMMQLAAQHIGCQPLLAPLPPGDRLVIARALAKVPDHRFPSCAKLVAALLKAPRPQGSLPRAPESQPSVETGTRSIADDPTPGESFADSVEPSRPDLQPPDSLRETAFSENQSLPEGLIRSEPVSQVTDGLRETVIPEVGSLARTGEVARFEPLPGARNGIRPTLFLGVGGLAGAVLGRLKKRLTDKYGDRTKTPAFAILLLDTDRDDLRRARQDPSIGALTAEETLLTPLHPPEHYRTSSKKLLRWLDRRWLYGIPRSLLTRGLRPLGRLALVDNAPEILSQIRDALVRITRPEAIATTALAANSQIRDETPRIFMVASITGGTGGGMLVSLAYAVRQILEELGQSPGGMTGMFLHATSPKVEDREMARVNASATLTELDQLCRLGAGYPGEPESGLKPFRAQEPPFQDNYVLQLGESIDRVAAEAAAAAVGDYLYLDTTSEGGGCLDLLRLNALNDLTSRGSFRTFGLARVDAGNERPDDAATRSLSRQLFEHWLCDPGAEELQELTRLVQREAASRGLEERSLSLALEAAVNTATGNRPDAFIPQVLARASTVSGSTREALMLPYVDEAFAPRRENQRSETTASVPSLHGLVSETARTYGIEIGATLVTWLSQLTAKPGKRFRNLERCAELFKKTISSLSKAAQARSARSRARRQSLRQRIEGERATSTATPSRAGPRPAAPVVLRIGRDLDEYCRLWLRETADDNIVTLLSAAQAQIEAFLEEESHFCRQLRTVIDRFRPPVYSKPPRSSPKAGLSAAGGKLPPPAGPGPTTEDTAQPGLMQQFDRSLEPAALAELGWLCATVPEAGETRRRPVEAARLTPEQFADLVLARARAVIQGAAKQPDTARLFVRTHGGPESALSVLMARARTAQPRLTIPESRQHLIVVLPQGAAWAGLNEMLARALHSPPGSLVRWDEEVLLCGETSGCSLPAVTRALLGAAEIPMELVRSVMTRLDSLPVGTITIADA